jgi:hypothetical protein
MKVPCQTRQIEDLSGVFNERWLGLFAGAITFLVQGFRSEGEPRGRSGRHWLRLFEPRSRSETAWG